jgi:hypothetical protein
MILKRYGGTYHRVELNFDAKALTEVGFRRERGEGVPVDEFEATHRRIAGHDLDGTAEGDVHDEVEKDVLAALETRIRALVAGLGEDEVLVVESGPRDHPKTRATQRTVVRHGENRLHFTIRIEPPLRVGIYRRSG